VRRAGGRNVWVGRLEGGVAVLAYATDTTGHCCAWWL
jgi:hypothetical protein